MYGASSSLGTVNWARAIHCSDLIFGGASKLGHVGSRPSVTSLELGAIRKTEVSCRHRLTGSGNAVMVMTMGSYQPYSGSAGIELACSLVLGSRSCARRGAEGPKLLNMERCWHDWEEWQLGTGDWRLTN
jgi:hypothetical protein